MYAARFSSNDNTGFPCRNNQDTCWVYAGPVKADLFSSWCKARPWDSDRIGDVHWSSLRVGVSSIQMSGASVSAVLPYVESDHWKIGIERWKGRDAGHRARWTEMKQLHLLFSLRFFSFAVLFRLSRLTSSRLVAVSKQWQNNHHALITSQSVKVIDRNTPQVPIPSMFAAQVPIQQFAPPASTDQYDHRETIWRILFDAVSLIICKERNTFFYILNSNHFLCRSSVGGHNHLPFCCQAVHSRFFLFRYVDSLSVQRQHDSNISGRDPVHWSANRLGSWSLDWGEIRWSTFGFSAV